MQAFIGGLSLRMVGRWFAEGVDMAPGGHLGDDLANFGFSVDTASGFA